MLAALYAHPSWLNAGDTSWQLTAATLVGLMSLPGLAVLYGGLVQRKWAVNTMIMAFSGFATVLVAWVLWGFNMSFGSPLKLGPGFFSSFVGIPGPVLGHTAEQARAHVPLLQGLMPDFRFPQSSLVYFQFVFAAITPLLFLGSLVGRMNFKVWIPFVLLWSSLVYTVNAFMLWGGGYWAAKGAVDYSGGYVIHLAAGVSGFVAAAVIGPRLLRDREHTPPNNLIFAAVGAGLLWLGWNGFNGGDPYFANPDASAAVLNTNLAAAVALLTWIIWDSSSSRRKPTFVGAINGMIVGLVAITPAAGYVNGTGAIAIGAIASSLSWFTMNVLGKRGIFAKVDDSLGVVHTHGVAGLAGGLLVGLLADPNMTVYFGSGKTASISVTGLLYGNPKQLWLQFAAAMTIIVFDGIMTFLILKLLGLFIPLRMPDAMLEIGDAAAHGEAVYDDGPVSFDLAEPAPLPHHEPALSGSNGGPSSGASLASEVRLPPSEERPPPSVP